MASLLRTAALLLPPPWPSPAAAALPATELRRVCASLAYSRRPARPLRLKLPGRLHRLAATEAEEAANTATQDDSENEVPAGSVADDGAIDTEEKVTSVIMMSLQSYKEALHNNDVAKIAEIESFLLSIEDETNSLKNKVATLTAELTSDRDRILRISADFDNFRKRTERERLSLMTNVQGEVIESLLPVIDNFERAKMQIKVETEGEEKINNSYQSIYKQFVEVLKSLGVEAVETIGKAFDPMLHEAIMREESVEYEEGIIIQEFRRGFKLGERLLRPAMVKVSAGPGPAKTEDEDPTVVEDGIAPQKVEDNEEEEEGGDGGEDAGGDAE